MAYSVGGRCLAFHGPLLYEAKILRAYDPVTNKVTIREHQEEKKIDPVGIPDEFNNKQVYFVHYKGWKSTWDEWILPERMLAWNEENIKTQKELKQAALSADAAASSSQAASLSSSKRKKEASSSAVTGENAHDSDRDHRTSTSRSIKRSRGLDDLEREEDYLKRPEIALHVPDLLKALLVDDWEYVTKDHKIVKLPASPNVVTILTKYKNSKAEDLQKSTSTAEAEVLDEVVAGIKTYFDKALGNMLLYRYERQQYLEVTKAHKNKEMSEIYGAPHLLRLFVTFPGLLAQTNMDPQSTSVLRVHLEDFLQFLTRHHGEFFKKEYEDTSQRYEALVRG